LIWLLQVPKGNPYHSATSGEMAIYKANSLILRKVIPLAYSFGKGTLANGHGVVLKLFCVPAQRAPFPPSFQAGAQIADPVVDTFNGQEVEVWPRMTWSPRWGLTFKSVKEKVHDNSSVSQRSALVINGQNVFLEGLSLDGTLIVNAVDEAEVIHHIEHR
jgi:UDP-sugar pyrophosphorylase